MRLALVALVVALAAPLGLPTRADASDFWEEVKTPGLRRYRYQLERANVALRARRYEEALAAADAAIAVVEVDARGHVLRALALGELRRMDEAMEGLRAALELDPRCLDAIADGRRAAELAAVAGDYALAAHALERVLGHMHPGRMRRTLYALYGDILLALGPDRLRDAVSAYREALRGRSGSNERATLGLALALDRVGERVESEGLLRDIAASENIDALVQGMALPQSERAARLALVATHAGDRERAIEQWAIARDSAEWSDAALAHLRALESSP